MAGIGTGPAPRNHAGGWSRRQVPEKRPDGVPEIAAATGYPDDDERGVQPLLPPLSARMWRQSASVTGALQLGFADVLQWWEARFERITLEDRNLPEIAARRVLRPRNEAAR